jgi:valyl-tRNA synthetase
VHAQAGFIISQPYPHVQTQIIDKKLERHAQTLFDVISQIRNLRSQISVAADEKVTVSLYAHSRLKQQLLKDNQGLIVSLARLQKVNLLLENTRPTAVISALIENVDIYLHLTGLIDVEKELLKIKQKLQELERMKSAKQARIDNPEFVKKAPQEVVAKEREGIAKLDDEIKRLEKMCHELH